MVYTHIFLQCWEYFRSADNRRGKEKLKYSFKRIKDNDLVPFFPWATFQAVSRDLPCQVTGDDAFGCHCGNTGPKSSISPKAASPLPIPAVFFLTQLGDALWTSHLSSVSPPKNQPPGPAPALSQLERCLNRMIFASITPESPGMEQLHCTTRILAAQEKAVMGKARSKQGRCPSTAGSSQHLPLLPYLRLELNPPCSSPWQRIRTHQFSICRRALYFFLYIFFLII